MEEDLYQFSNLFFNKKKALPKHEEKFCPNCRAKFECKVGSISLCQCTKVKITPEESAYLTSLFDDCLCFRCMESITREYRITKLYKSLTWSF
ncbi:cysteine-rich CWC family protein [Leptospira sp. 96542]|nr:cysteine-rich CWC family protein [Leptospira sp. 96542]